MRKNYDIRLAALREYLKSLSADETTFIVEGGEFHTSEDPFSYLMQHGAYTHDGKRIVLFPHPVEGLDALSLSLYEMLDEAIEGVLDKVTLQDLKDWYEQMGKDYVI